MILTIITINRNNAAGLEKTMQSVLDQKCNDFEYVVVDGESVDCSVDVIQRFARQLGKRIRWISEPDKGIYNAMNKGIGMASGKYLQFLNSGDCLATEDVVEKVFVALENNGYPSILYGNMLKDNPEGILRDKCFAGQDISFLGFYDGTLNHSPAFIRRDLFDEFGRYDESLMIVSDWKWFLQAIIFGGVKPVYSDIDISLFDMNGISETNKELGRIERRRVLSEFVPAAILADYARWSFPIDQMKRLQRHPWANKIVWFLERCLFKIEKRQIIQSRTVQYR